MTSDDTSIIEKKTTVGDDIHLKNRAWSFSGDIPLNFDDHVARSIPLYKEGHALIKDLSDFFLRDNSVCYDIGCSTGSLLALLAEHNQEKNIRYIGLDIESDMIMLAKNRHKFKNIDFIHANIAEEKLKKADLIISYYTIQFIHPMYRQDIFDKIYESLNWGGAFLLFEKVRGTDARFQDIISQLYIDFKMKNNFTAEEIISKSTSLKGVLEPYTEEANIDYLTRAGFKDYMSILKYLSFEGLLAIK
jgi:tRNA (cmo5U34)-methyltransferase